MMLNTQLPVTVPKCTFKSGRPSRSRPSCSAAYPQQQDANRRAVLQGTGAALLALFTPRQASAAGKTQTTSVGSYLPKTGDGDFVQFKPSDTQTPAIRAGVIKASDSYQFVLPPTWSEQRIANIQSGNFCMPRCDEPWQEMIFADSSEGKATLYVMNLRRLTNRAGATIDQVGPPTGILQSLGPYITGTYLDEEDLLATDKVSKNGRTYYVYEAKSISGNGGPHYVSVATTKNDLVYLFTVAASDPQWNKAQQKLKKVADSFVV